MFPALSDPDLLWIVVTGFVISFVLAFGIGANDVANSFGTSVGAKVLTLRQACILATIFEVAGSLLLGAKVSETIRKGIIDNNLYSGGPDDTELLLLGLVAALGGSCIWLLIATFARVPVSGTHSIVGATVGFSLVAKGFQGVNWYQLGLIVASWFASPVLSALVSVFLFFLVQHFILNKPNPLEYGLRALPFIYGITLVTNLFSIFYEGPPLLRFHLIPTWGAFLSSFGIGLLCSVVIKFLVVPSLRGQIRRYCKRRREEEQRELLEAEERARAKLEEEQNGAAVTDDADQESPLQKGKNNKTKACIRKLKARFGKKTKETVEYENAKAIDDDPAKLSRTPSDASRSLISTYNDHASGVHDPLISSCSQLPTGDSDVKASTRSTSTSKLEVVDGGLTATNPKGSKSPVPKGKSGKFLVERIDHENDGLATTVRSACTSTTSIFREANAVAKAALDEKHLEGDSTLNPKVDVEVDADKEEEPTRTCCGKKVAKEQAREVVDSPESARLFSFLQILTAIFGAFAHGGNDVSNAIGPLIGIWLTATTTGNVPSVSQTPWWILIYGGAGISVGLWVWGRRVIQTLGEDLTKVTPSSGFCIELGAALTVLIASNAKLPVSTTHCKVGSVVGVGRFRSRDNVDWRVFRNIILAWFVTVPASAALGAGLMYGLMQIARLVSPPNEVAGNSTFFGNETTAWVPTTLTA